MTHSFGGDWTEQKLAIVKDYLRAYTQIMRRNAIASRYFTTHYVDAFAGTGYRNVGSESDDLTLQLDELDQVTEARDWLHGSAHIALEVDPPFDHYHFIDSNPTWVAELEALKRQFPAGNRRISIHRAEANDYLKGWCDGMNWGRNRAVVFLDPYGMQVDWSLIESIAATRAIDLWLLFPLGVAVNRLLTRGQPPPEGWAAALTRVFGTDD